MDSQQRGLILPAALTVVVVAGLVMNCSSESEPSVVSSDAGGDRGIITDAFQCVPWPFDGCPYQEICYDAGADVEPCCECVPYA